MIQRNRITIMLMSLVMTAFLLSMPLMAQEDRGKENKKVKAEMKEALGTVPVMFEEYPDHLKAEAWEWFQATQSPDGAIPPKYAQLVSLGVAAQIPCNYCVYAHTTMAKMFGATEAEIKEAVAKAAETRHWSTVLNGADVSLDEFKTEWDGMLEHMKEHSKSKETANK